MNSIVLELQRDAMESSITVSDLLRKSLVVARKLEIADFEEWVSLEMNGYDASKLIPSYRSVRGVVKAKSPVLGWIPVIIPDERLNEFYCKQKITQPASSLESLHASSDTVIMMNYPAEVEASLMKATGSSFLPVLHVGKNQFHAIVDAIRNTILDWALKLEKEGILGEGLMFTLEEKSKAQKISIRIDNFQGILGDVTGSTVTQLPSMDVRKNDFETLSDYLKSVGLDENDIKLLKEAVDNQPIPTSPDSLGPQVGPWLGRMVGKAASGAWKIATGTAASLLNNAIASYFGLSR